MLRPRLRRVQPNHRFLIIGAAIASLSIASACGSDPGYGGRSSADWIIQLDSGNTPSRADAAHALGKVLGSRPDYPMVVTALVGALSDTSDVVRIAAASALTAEGVDIRAAIDGLHKVMHDSVHADVRASVVLIVSSLGPKRASALLPYLCEMLDDPSPRVRAAAVRAIGHIGPAALPEVVEISRMMRDSSADVRESVLGALVNLGASGDVLLPLARSALKDGAATVRSSAADALRYLAPASAPAAEDLAVALRDPNENVVRSAVVALGSIGPAARKAVPSLRQLRYTAAERDHAIIDETIAIIEGRRAVHRGASEPTLIDICTRYPRDLRC